MMMMGMPRDRFERPFERRQSIHVRRPRSALNLDRAAIAITNRRNAGPVFDEPRKDRFAFADHSHVDVELVQAGARSSGCVRSYRHECPADVADISKLLSRYAQFRRRTPPEQITRSR